MLIQTTARILIISLAWSFHQVNCMKKRDRAALLDQVTIYALNKSTQVAQNIRNTFTQDIIDDTIFYRQEEIESIPTKKSLFYEKYTEFFLEQYTKENQPEKQYLHSSLSITPPPTQTTENSDQNAKDPDCKRELRIECDNCSRTMNLSAWKYHCTRSATHWKALRESRLEVKDSTYSILTDDDDNLKKRKPEEEYIKCLDCERTMLRISWSSHILTQVHQNHLQNNGKKTEESKYEIVTSHSQ